MLGGPAHFPYPSGRRIYERWTPAVVYRDRAVPAALSGPDRIVGAPLAVWGDRAGAESQARVAARIRVPLRALAQKLWDPGPPTLSWREFEALASRVS